MCVGLPAVFSLWAIMLFNNGFHGAHHEASGKHWSKLPAAHARFASDVAPELNQKSLFGYWVKQYLLAPFMPGLGTTQMGSGPQQMPDAIETAGGSLPLHATRALAQAAIVGAT